MTVDWRPHQSPIAHVEKLSMIIPAAEAYQHVFAKKMIRPDANDKDLSLDQIRKKSLQHTFDKLLWILRGFGVLRSPSTTLPYSSTARAGALLCVVILLLLLFIAQLTYMFLNAIAGVTTISVVEIHFISHTQYVITTILGMLAFAWRSAKLPAIVSAVVRGDSWSSSEADWFLVGHVRMTSWSFIVYLVLQFTGVLLVKVTSIRGLQDSFFGLPVPAALLSGGLITLLTVSVLLRTTHLSVMTLTTGILGLLFRRITQKVKQEPERDSRSHVSRSAKSLGEALHQHFYLSELTEELDTVFAPSSLIYLGSDIVLVTSLISYFISGSTIEAPMGLFVTHSTADMITYLLYGAGAIGMLLTRVAASAFLNHQAHSVIPELYKKLQEPDLEKRLISDVTITLGRLRDMPVGLTGWDLFMLNKYFILTVNEVLPVICRLKMVLGLLATYLVVVVEISTKNECGMDSFAALLLKNTSGIIR